MPRVKEVPGFEDGGRLPPSNEPPGSALTDPIAPRRRRGCVWDGLEWLGCELGCLGLSACSGCALAGLVGVVGMLTGVLAMVVRFVW